MAALKYWLWLTNLEGMDAVGALTVLDHFVTPERAYYADPEEYELLPLRPGLSQALLDKGMDGAERILEACERLGLRVMTFQDADYPQRLRALADPPAVWYILGRTFHFDEAAAIAVVGTREPSGYGRVAAEKLGLELSAGGALVLSGIAEGLDACAIRGALNGGGPVVSVLAGGVDMIFPPKHGYLYADVAAKGALISEYPPGTKHRGYHFPRRNRILSGLSLGVLAVECRPFGGTMSTVNHALEQDRDVFAVPGAIDAPMSEGILGPLSRQAETVGPPDSRGRSGQTDGRGGGTARFNRPPGPRGERGGHREGKNSQGGAETALHRRRAGDFGRFGGPEPLGRPGGGADPDSSPPGAVRPDHAPGPGDCGGAPGTAFLRPGGAGAVAQIN